ncbi:MAG: type II toxin-antitoxin system HicA family toxin [Synergistaceae bacterium]|nr:type II toxin-antitoxin system HicA family toxin [Synergistaceae bacterium]
MPRWNDLIRFLDRNAIFLRHGGNHDIYLYNSKRIRVSRGSGEIDRNTWRKILKQQLGITQEEFNEGLK